MAQNEQLLVITHSAQVAGFADKHFKISKHSKANKTTTTIIEINDFFIVDHLYSHNLFRVFVDQLNNRHDRKQ